MILARRRSPVPSRNSGGQPGAWSYPTQRVTVSRRCQVAPSTVVRGSGLWPFAVKAFWP